jgi:hypothetical protein
MEVDVINKEICYSEFYEKYLVNNRICLLSKLFTDSWPCRKQWVESEAPNWDNLLENYGKLLSLNKMILFVFNFKLFMITSNVR